MRLCGLIARVQDTKFTKWDSPGGPVAKWLRHHTFNAERAQVLSLVRELDPHAITKSAHALTKDPACRN